MGSLALVVMAKAPLAGEVKTRLCPPLTPAEAAELYRCFVLDTVERVRKLATVQPVMAYTPPAGRAWFEELVPDFILMPQQGADLGVRMATCFERLFTQGYTGVLLTGSDLPTLPLAHLQRAAACLTVPGIDVVLGPSEDGGYYLIGLRHLYPELFEDMVWSTAQVYAETVRRAEACGLTVASLPPWFDVDTPAELERLRDTLIRGPESSGSFTRRFLQHRSN
jgi:rSAM/selenodomain-associated transferase 1